MTNSENEPIQRAFELNVPIRQEILREKAGMVMLQFTERVLPTLYSMVVEGKGKEDLGSVPGRPGEKQALIDAVGQDRLINTIRDQKLPAIVIGEHTRQDHTGNNETYVYFSQDPFDNTSPYKRGLPTPVFSVLSSYDQDSNPIGGVVINIPAKKAYMNIDGEASVVSFDIVDGDEIDEGTNEPIKIAKIIKKEPMQRSQRRTLIHQDATISSFVGEKDFMIPFNDNFRLLLENFSTKTMIYGEGGAFAWGLLAAGVIDAIAVRDEWRSEIDPGLALAQLAGCTIVSVDPETGEFEDYKFDPTAEDDVPLLIAAATPEIRDEIIRYYMEQKRQDEEKAKNMSNMETFIARHREEFDIFVAGQETPQA